MTYEKLENGTFKVNSSKNNGSHYIVNTQMDACNCPMFKYISKGTYPCKHIEEVREKESAPTQDPISVGEFKKWCPAEYVNLLSEQQFCVVYGELQFGHLLKTFEVIVINNMVRIL